MNRVRLGLVCLACTMIACRTRPSFHVAGDSYVAKDDSVPPKTAIYDDRVLHLRGVRGETLGVQILGATHLEAPVRLRLHEEKLATITSFVATLSTVSEPSTAMYGPSRGAGRYADALEHTGHPRTSRAPVYFDIAIDKAAHPGKHFGELVVGTLHQAVELTIEPFTIDVEAAPSVWVYYMPKEIAWAHGLKDDDSADQIAFERRYHDLFRAHGALLASDLPPARFEKRREFLRGARYFPVHIDTSGPEQIAADVKTWLGIFEKEHAIPFAIPVDEPSDPAARKRAKDIALAIGQAGGGAPRLLRVVTAARHPELGDAFDVYMRPGVVDESQSHRWTYNGRPPDAGSMIIDTHGTALRARGWLSARHNVELWYIWDGLYFTDRYNGQVANDVAVKPITFDERRGKKGGTDFGNGDGVLVHPKLVPTLRLKALRRGVSDRLLLQKLIACGQKAEADAIMSTILPKWPDDEGPFEAARRRVLDALVAHCPHD